MSHVYYYLTNNGKIKTMYYVPKNNYNNLIEKVNNSVSYKDYINLYQDYKISKKQYNLIKQSIQYGINQK